MRYINNKVLLLLLLSLWRHKICHIFHFLQSDMNFEIVSHFLCIFNSISREKRGLISVPYIMPVPYYYYYDNCFYLPCLADTFLLVNTFLLILHVFNIAFMVIM